MRSRGLIGVVGALLLAGCASTGDAQGLGALPPVPDAQGKSMLVSIEYATPDLIETLANGVLSRRQLGHTAWPYVAWPVIHDGGCDIYAQSPQAVGDRAHSHAVGYALTWCLASSSGRWYRI